ncbi:WD40/YVTN/BNR-like repeat-containing protein, partial [Chloroflexota bacterium]
EDDHCRFGMDIVERGVIWSCGRGTPHQPGEKWRSGVSLSTDEGRSWENVSPIEGVGNLHPRGLGKGAAWGGHISFLDDQTGWVASKYTFLAATSNGGQSWSVLPLPENIPNIAAIHLRTPDEGYLLDYAGNLHTTRDAGQSWTSQELIRAKGMEMLTVSAMCDTAAIRFADKNNGLVATSILGDGGSECVIMRTSDGGRTWQKETLPVKIALTYYISRDCTLITVIDFYRAESIVVLKYA